MPKFSTYVDVDIHEFMEECSKREIKELIDYLVEDGHIKPSSKITPSRETAISRNLAVRNGITATKYPQRLHFSQLTLLKCLFVP